MVATVAASAQKDSLEFREYMTDTFMPRRDAFGMKAKIAIDLFSNGYYESGIKRCVMALEDCPDDKDCRVLLRSVYDWDRVRFHQAVDSSDYLSDIDWKLYISSYEYSDWK